MTVFRANDADVIALRRDLHAYPELGFLEYRTAALAAQRLRRLGYAVRLGPEVMRSAAMAGVPTADAITVAQRAALDAGAPQEWVSRMPDGQTGIVADMTRGTGPVLAFRFDMDALPVAEASDAAHRPQAHGFRSRNDGWMHACGHDGHTAIGLAVAERLAAAGATWQGTIRLIFQPAEEGGRGARPMVEAGVVDDADFFFAGHLGCKLPTGCIAAQATGFLFSRKLDVTFHGQAAHAAMAPQEGRNALLSAATAVLGLHAIARHGESATHVNVGRLVAGGGRNVIADRADMQMEVRGDTQESLDYMAGRAIQVLEGAAAMQGAQVETVLMGETIGGTASKTAADIVALAASGVEGVTRVLPAWPIGGGEDATFMMQRVQQRGGQAAYCIIGSDSPAGHHARNFDVDERALQLGVALFEGIAGRVLSDNAVPAGLCPK